MVTSYKMKGSNSLLSKVYKVLWSKGIMRELDFVCIFPCHHADHVMAFLEIHFDCIKLFCSIGICILSSSAQTRFKPFLTSDPFSLCNFRSHVDPCCHLFVYFLELIVEFSCFDQSLGFPFIHLFIAKNNVSCPGLPVQFQKYCG